MTRVAPSSPAACLTQHSPTSQHTQSPSMVGLVWAASHGMAHSFTSHVRRMPHGLAPSVPSHALFTPHVVAHSVSSHSSAFSPWCSSLTHSLHSHGMANSIPYCCMAHSARLASLPTVRLACPAFHGSAHPVPFHGSACSVPSDGTYPPPMARHIFSTSHSLAHSILSTAWPAWPTSNDTVHSVISYGLVRSPPTT